MNVDASESALRLVPRQRQAQRSSGNAERRQKLAWLSMHARSGQKRTFKCFAEGGRGRARSGQLGDVGNWAS